MLESLENLGLDAARVRRQREVYAGIGRAYLAHAQSQEDPADRELTLFAAATNLRRAAANSLLLNDTDQGTRLFDEAAETYVAAGTAYGFFLELFGRRQRRSERRFPYEPKNAADVWLLWSPDAMLHDLRVSPEKTVRFRRQLDAYRTERVGILGLPVAAHLELFDSLALPPLDTAEYALSEALFPFLGAYSAAIRRCRSDHYHWSRLTMPFHPIEPDILGVLLVVSRWLTSQQRSVSRTILALPIGGDVITLIRGTLRQFDAWDD